MELNELVIKIADILKSFDSEKPTHKHFQPGIGPFGEPQLVKEICKRLNQIGAQSQTKRTPDLSIDDYWAIEIKIVRPFGDNGDQAEDWSVNMLHPYEGNTSLIGDAMKLQASNLKLRKGIMVIGFEHANAKISLDPLISSFEIIVGQVIGLNLSARIEEKRIDLVHPVHQVVRCIAWELL